MVWSSDEPSARDQLRKESLQTRFRGGKIPRGKAPKQWADQIKNDTRLPLLTAERNCWDRVKWKKSTMEKALRNTHTSQ